MSYEPDFVILYVFLTAIGVVSKRIFEFRAI